MMAPIRIALMGAGLYARTTHMPALKSLSDQFEIAAIFSRTEERAASLAEQAGNAPDIYTDLDALLARGDIEAVDVLLPIEQLPMGVERALAAGKHVISEKPIATDVKTGRELLAAHDSHPNQVWMVAENWRYEAAFIAAASLMARSAIGAPLICFWTVHIAMTPDNRYYQTPWRRSGTFPGGFLLDIGVHHAATMRLVMGQEITRVSAFTRQMRPDLPPADTLSAALAFENGVIGSYAVSFAAGVPFPTYLTIVGDKGVLRADRDFLELTVNGTAERLPLAKDKSINEELKAFAAAIRSGEPHRNTPREALQDVAVVEAMLRSAETGMSIEVERV